MRGCDDCAAWRRTAQEHGAEAWRLASTNDVLAAEVVRLTAALAIARQAARDFYHCAIEYRGDRASALAERYPFVRESG